MNSNLNNISDGKLYKANDKVDLLSNDCAGCCQCCIDMGDSIVLDPYDVYLLTSGLDKSFDQLINEGRIEFTMNNGLPLPNLKMVPKFFKEGLIPGCSFLNERGRCEIHDFRPGICRLFPLGRDFREGELSYFLLKDACLVERRGKVEINKWLGHKNIKEYEDFLISWHDLRKQISNIIKDTDDETYAKAISTGFLKLFYMTPYNSKDFFEEYYSRLNSL